LLVPGYEKDKFSIKLEGNLLTISAAQKEAMKKQMKKLSAKNLARKHSNGVSH
jgi:HSP20 family molecular chaperone IbpA